MEALEQWFLTGGDFTPTSFHTGVFTLGMGCSWHLVGTGLGSCRAQDRELPQQRFFLPQMSVVPKLRMCALE